MRNSIKQRPAYVIATFSDRSTDSFRTAPAQLEGEGYTTFLWIDPNGTTDTVEGKGSIVRDAAGNFLQLTDDKGNVLIDATNVTAEGSKAILGYLAERFFTEFSLEKDGAEWEGILHAGMQCKRWVDDVIVQGATGIDLPSNEGGNEALTGKWGRMNSAGIDVFAGGLISEQLRIEDGQKFSEHFITSDIQEGDIVQYRAENYPHTMIITKIETTGMCVMDSNYSSEMPDETIRCHFYTFDALDNDILVGTIYRIHSQDSHD